MNIILSISDNINWENTYYVSGLIILIVNFALLIIALLTLLHYFKVQKENTRPYVIFYVYRYDLQNSYINLCLENIGKTGAYDVQIDKEIEYYCNNYCSKFKTKFKFLAPNQNIQTLLTSSNKNIDTTGTITYRDYKGKKYTDSFSLDFKSYVNTAFIKSPLHEISINIGNIKSSISAISKTVSNNNPKKQMTAEEMQEQAKCITLMLGGEIINNNEKE